MRMLLAVVLLAGCKADPCKVKLGRVDAAREKMQGSTRAVDYTDFIAAVHAATECFGDPHVIESTEVRDAMLNAARLTKEEEILRQRRETEEMERRLKAGQKPDDRTLQGLGL